MECNPPTVELSCHCFVRSPCLPEASSGPSDFVIGHNAREEGVPRRGRVVTEILECQLDNGLQVLREGPQGTAPAQEGILLSSTRHNVQHAIRQRPLQVQRPTVSPLSQRSTSSAVVRMTGMALG